MGEDWSNKGKEEEEVWTKHGGSTRTVRTGGCYAVVTPLGGFPVRTGVKAIDR